MSDDDIILQTQDLTLRYDSLTAVDSVNLRVRRGERHALIGPNGAGKSSLFGVLTGRIRASNGTIIFNGEDVTRLRESARARAGLVRTFQHSSLFLGMSALDNVRIAVERRAGHPKRAFPLPRRDRKITEEALTHLDTVGLAGRYASICGAMSHGERRQVEVAMVLACRASIMLFDEPTAGMSVAETARFAEIVESLPPTVTVMIVEHDLDIVFQLADRVSVLTFGQLIAEGPPKEVRANSAVQEAYLGVSDRETLFLGAGEP